MTAPTSAHGEAPVAPAPTPTTALDWEQLGVPMIMLANDARMLRANKAFRLLALSADCEDIGTGTDWLSMLDTDARTQLYAALAERRTHVGPLGWVGNSGLPVRWLSVSLRWQVQGTSCLCILHDVTPVKQSEQLMQVHMEAALDRIDGIPLPMAYLDVPGHTCLYTNALFAQTFEVPAHKRHGSAWAEVVGRDLARVCRPAIDHVQRMRTAIRLEQPYLLPAPPDTAPEDQRWLQITLAPHLDRVSVLIGLYVLVEDTTQSYAQSQSMQASRQRLGRMVQAGREGIAMEQAGLVVDANPALCRLLDLPLDQIIGRPLQDFVLASPAGALRRANGSALAVEWIERRQPISDGPVVVSVIRDASEAIRSSTHIHHLLHHDPLTGLANRAAMLALIRRDLSQPHHNAGLIHLGLDRFEALEATLGIEHADLVLREVAKRLRVPLRSSDSVACADRQAFWVWVPELRQESDLEAIARRLKAYLETPISLAGMQVVVEASIGTAYSTTEAPLAVQALVQNAQIALQQSRGATAGPSSVGLKVLRLESQIRNALANQALALHFQPQLRCSDGAPIGADARLRWHHPDDHWLDLPAPAAGSPAYPGGLSPSLLQTLGLWMIRAAARAARPWQHVGMPAWFSVALPISAAQWQQRDFIAQVQRILVEEQIPGTWLEFKLAGAILQQPSAPVDERLGALRQLGVRLSVEPLGLEAIALERLRTLAIDKLKIGRLCVAGLPGDATCAVAARAVLDLARSRGLSVIAEGVDTEAQHRFMVENGCDFVQGNAIGPGMQATELQDWLAQAGGIPTSC
ncbi:EAL domain-containing protein [Leptothrix ochracea]|uniref:EAL domain-containing protein n=1 Tax=Leptothrix ochracea TaxID=735331 RepID=UPI0034E26397